MFSYTAKLPRTVIGIAGGFASGKLSLAVAFIDRLQKHSVQAICVNVGPKLDSSVLTQTLKLWKGNESVSMLDDDGKEYNLSSVNVVVLIGRKCYIYPELAKMIDVKIFMDCDTDLALARKILQINPKSDELSTTLDNYFKRNVRCIENNLLQKRTADVIVLNNGRIPVKDLMIIDILESYVVTDL